MNKNQLRLLTFLLKYPCSWQSIGKDSLRTARSLEGLGLIVLNEHNQARLAFNADIFKALEEFNKL
jgi:hypothetical protein